MTGTLALVGGREHHAGCEPIDRALLEASGAPRPLVAIVPLASSLRTRARTVGRAIEWWERLGARTVVAPPDGPGAVDVLDGCDVIVMTGGVPDRLHRRLHETGIGAHVLRRWTAGVPLSGSSSGAMVIPERRQSLRPPFGVDGGFGLLRSVAVAPHHELIGPRLVTTVRSRTHPHLVILGIEERTALVGRAGVFQVLGVGRVHVRRGAWRRTYGAGEVVTPAAIDDEVPRVVSEVPTPPPLHDTVPRGGGVRRRRAVRRLPDRGHRGVRSP